MTAGEWPHAPDSADMPAILYFTFGILALNFEGNRATARAWLTRAIDSSDNRADLDHIHVSAAFALARASTQDSAPINNETVDDTEISTNVVRRIMEPSVSSQSE